VAKCCKFAKTWGYGGIVVANTFAYRCTDQGELKKVSDPIGPDNDAHIIEMAKQAAIVIFAYGKPQHKQLRSRGPEVARMILEKAKVTPHILSSWNRRHTEASPVSQRNLETRCMESVTESVQNLALFLAKRPCFDSVRAVARQNLLHSQNE
jgi:hypothetical protein